MTDGPQNLQKFLFDFPRFLTRGDHKYLPHFRCETQRQACSEDYTMFSKHFQSVPFEAFLAKCGKCSDINFKRTYS